jgi:aminodeoxyfutalosine deaminase
MYQHGRGPLFDWLRSQRDMSDCGRGSPIRYLAQRGFLGENLLAIHANYLAPGDTELLARAAVSVIHCPRSHAYFQHQQFPYSTLSGQGVNVCLGTDSLASVTSSRGSLIDLNLFSEMQALALAVPAIAPRTILEMATVRGARALGLAGEVGELMPGALADMIAIPFQGRSEDAYEAALHCPGSVLCSMIEGEWAIPPKSV